MIKETEKNYLIFENVSHRRAEQTQLNRTLSSVNCSMNNKRGLNNKLGQTHTHNERKRCSLKSGD